ncbi:hypothetical protein SDC9_26093 [bioreactor metagenome]|uniref:Uncharacterized protein n=1 Tax=bioreactor metagenome TaxID=1076179 RepID=A0A644UMG8_9ZZZZ
MRPHGQLGHARQNLGRGLALAHQLHDRRADDTAIGDARDGTRRLGGGDAEAHHHRQIGRGLDPRNLRADVARLRRLTAGDAGDRDVIDESGGVLQHLRQALVIGRRRRETDEVQPRVLRRDAELRILLGRQVDDDQPVDTGLQRIGHELFAAAVIDRVIIAHHHDRRDIVGLAELGHHVERLLQGLTAVERALTGKLDRRAVRHRIGEGHAELDHVDARRGHPLHHRERGLDVRVSRHDIGDEGLLPLGLQRGKSGIDASHVRSPALSARVCGMGAGKSMPKGARLAMQRAPA